MLILLIPSCTIFDDSLELPMWLMDGFWSLLLEGGRELCACKQLTQTVLGGGGQTYENSENSNLY